MCHVWAERDSDDETAVTRMSRSLEEDVVGRERPPTPISQCHMNFPKAGLNVRDNEAKLFDARPLQQHFAGVCKRRPDGNHVLMPPYKIDRDLGAVCQKRHVCHPVNEPEIVRRLPSQLIRVVSALTRFLVLAACLRLYQGAGDYVLTVR